MPEKIRIYRLEHTRTGHGIFSMYFGGYASGLTVPEQDEQNAYSLLLNRTSRYDKQVGSDVAGFIRGIHRCAVLTPGHLLGWFGESLLLDSKHFGYNIVELEIEDDERVIIKGEQQVAYIPEEVKTRTIVENIHNFIQMAKEQLASFTEFEAR